MSKKQIWNLVIDYKLWIAFIEQYLIDNHITTKEIYQKLNQTKIQLNQLGQTSTANIFRQIQSIDESLQTLQRQLLLSNNLQATSQ